MATDLWVDDLRALHVATEVLERQIKTIELLLNEGGDVIFHTYDSENVVTKKLEPLLSDASSSLWRISALITPPQRDRPADWKADILGGWREYRELRNKMTSLVNELLGVIVGAHLISKKLDDVQDEETYKDKLDESNYKAVSFSKVAWSLVKEVVARSGIKWDSFLFVGSERPSHSGTQIIRLRFPAWDIWTLPFAVHECAYLWASTECAISNVAIEKDDNCRWRSNDPAVLLPGFIGLCQEVKAAVNPAKHEAGLPENRECYLEAVQEFWTEYYAKSGVDRQAFLLDRREELERLENQQVEYICRLFADAFATVFAGPAYVYALFFLGFSPDLTLVRSIGGLPPLALRFAFALEMLNLMNARTDDLYAEAAVGLPELWQKTIEPLKNDAVMQGLDTSQALKQRYDAWLVGKCSWFEQISAALLEAYDSERGLRTTERDWSEAEKIAQKLPVGQQIRLDNRPSHLAILNAAWEARRQQRGDVMAITINNRAVRCFDRGDKSVLWIRSEQSLPNPVAQLTTAVPPTT